MDQWDPLEVLAGYQGISDAPSSLFIPRIKNTDLLHLRRLPIQNSNVIKTKIYLKPLDRRINFNPEQNKEQARNKDGPALRLKTIAYSKKARQKEFSSPKFTLKTTKIPKRDPYLSYLDINLNEKAKAIQNRQQANRRDGRAAL